MTTGAQSRERGRGRIPKTLLITHFSPSFRNGSIHHIGAVLERYSDRLTWYSTKAPIEPPDLPVPYQHGYLPSRPAGRALKPLRQHFVLGPWARKLGRDAADFGRRHGVELVWTQLSVESVVAGRVAAERLGVPLAVSALDDPEVLLSVAPGYLDWIRRTFRRQLHRTLRRASSYGVISQAMARDYARRHGVEARVLYVGVTPEETIEPPERPPAAEHEPRTLWIGSVGSVISAANWQLLQDAVAALNGELGRRAVAILHIGDLAECLRSPDIECTGWVNGEAMKEHLRRLDLCFLSMWFEAERAYSAKTAFPTKIRTFLAAHRPVLALGPEDSLTVDFVRGEKLGAVCTEPDLERLTAALRRLLFDGERYHRACVHVARAAELYTRDNYFRTFESFLLDAVQGGPGIP